MAVRQSKRRGSSRRWSAGKTLTRKASLPIRCDVKIRTALGASRGTKATPLRARQTGHPAVYVFLHVSRWVLHGTNRKLEKAMGTLSDSNGRRIALRNDASFGQQRNSVFGQIKVHIDIILQTNPGRDARVYLDGAALRASVRQRKRASRLLVR